MYNPQQVPTNEKKIIYLNWPIQCKYCTGKQSK